tara:strand:+ start:387 stop:818 length:432 start_codon:yes stop_codon:yes gene_type:complete
MKFFLKLLDRVGRKRVIMDRLSNEPYLTRYYLFLKERKWFPFNIFLHNFHKGDPDDLHDHPWPYCTIILKGGYWEHQPTGERKWRSPGTVRFAGSRSLHRIELEPGTDVWTLFIPGASVRDWGFIDNGEWKQHEQYLEERYKG